MSQRRANLPPKTCIICHTTFTRHQNSRGLLTEDANRYRARETCGNKTCVRTLQAQRGFEQQKPITPRTCACGQPIPRRPKDTPSKYAARKTCSAPTCQAQSKRRTHKTKPRKPRPTPAPRAPRTPCPSCGQERPTNRRKTCGAPTCITALKKAGAKQHAWTPAEDHIIRDTYPNQGSTEAALALRAAGYTRSADAAGNRARRLGLKTHTPTINHQPAILHIVTDYAGLPLTVEDVADELGIGQHSVKRYLRMLNEGGLIACRADPEWPSRKLYYAREASAA